MKKAPLIINVVLIIAVAVLYYLHFTSCAASCNAGTTDSLAAAKPVIISPKEIKESKMVYINSDVLNEKYQMVTDLTSAAQAKQQRLQNAYETKAQKFQQDYTELQDKANQGLLSENQANAAQEDLIKRKEELDRMEMQLQDMMGEMQKSREQVHKNVVNYIKEYNKTSQYNYVMMYTDNPGGFLIVANDSLDITNDIVEGLNAQYKAKKEAEKNKKK